jgi:valyl-tRNA synthetase
MVMMSLALCDTLPFKTVFLHSMVRDKFGRKMSKSLGNVIDPIDVIHGITLDELGDKLALGNLDPREVEKAKKGQKEQFPSGIPECGADALRFALLAYMSQTRDINLDISRVQGYRQFCNKLFNVLKFSLTNLKDFAPNTSTPSLIDSWMLSRLSNMVEKVNSSMQAYEFAEATTALYNFWLYELCDVYLEAIKPAMRLPEGDEKRKAAQQTLWTCMEVGFRAMHPFMPFLTEELWQRLPCIAKVKEEHNVCSIMIAPFPTTAQFASLRNTEVETLVAHALDIVHACRSVRAQYNLTTQRPASFVRTVVDIATVKDVIATLGQVGTVEVIGEEAREFCVVQVVDDKTEVLVEMKGMVDVDAEMKKLNKKVETVNKNMDTMKKKMTMPGYETKVPEAVRQQNNEQVVKLEEEERALRRAMEDMLKLK